MRAARVSKKSTAWETKVTKISRIGRKPNQPQSYWKGCRVGRAPIRGNFLVGSGHEHETMKHRIVHFVQRYLLNPPIKLLFAIGVVLPGYALLETTGRKTGKPRRTPVGYGLVGKQFWIVAEHGQKAGYVRNIAGNPRVRLKLRDGLRTRWYTGTAHLLSDDDAIERQRWLAIQVPGSASNAAAVRFFGTQLLTVRVDLDD